jgi:hypothetical protein
MVDIVGLRFVTEGQKQALDALGQYQKGLLNLGQLQDKHVATMNAAQNRQDSEARRHLQNYLRYQREQETATQRAARAREQAAAQAIAAQKRQDAEDRRAFQVYIRHQREREAADKRAAVEQTRIADQRAQMPLAVDVDLIAVANRNRDVDAGPVLRLQHFGATQDVLLDRLALRLARACDGVASRDEKRLLFRHLLAVDHCLRAVRPLQQHDFCRPGTARPVFGNADFIAARLGVEVVGSEELDEIVDDEDRPADFLVELDDDAGDDDGEA